MAHKATYKFYLNRSNPQHSEVPRVFFVKTIGDKISWAIELDEFHDVMIKSEFDKEEVEYYAEFRKIIDSTSMEIFNIFGEDEVMEFSETMLWNLETLMLDQHAISRSGDNTVFPLRPISRQKYQDNQAVIEAEAAHIASMRYAAENRSGGRRINYNDLFETEPQAVARGGKKKKRD